MKKLILLSLTLLFFIPAIAQQINLDDNVSINLPVGATKLDKDQLKGFANEQKYDTGIINPVTPIVYKLNDALFSFKSLKTTSQNVRLQELKDQLDRSLKTAKNRTHYESAMKNYKNYKVLLSSYTSQALKTYVYSAENSSGTWFMSIFVQCHKTDTLKTFQALNTMVESIKFKN